MTTPPPSSELDGCGAGEVVRAAESASVATMATSMASTAPAAIA